MLRYLPVASQRRAWFGSAIAAGVILLLVAPGAMAAWPMAGRDPAHSRSEGTPFEPSSNWVLDPVALGFGRWASPPALVDHLAIVGVSENATVALTEAGAVKWRTTLSNASEQRIAVDGDLAFVTLWDRSLVALNVSDGGIRWHRAFAERVVAEPTASAGRVAIATADGMVHLLLASDGTEQWAARARVYPETPPAFGPGATLIAPTNESLIAFRVVDGSVAWTHQGASSMVIPTETAIFLTSAEPRLYALDPASGHVKWSVPLSGGAPYFSLMDSALYVLTLDLRLQKFSATDGRQLWSVEIPNDVSYAPIFSQGAVLTYDWSGRLTRYSLENGRKLGEAQPGLMAIAPPVPAGDDVLVMTANPGKGAVLMALPVSSFHDTPSSIVPALSVSMTLLVILAASWAASRR